jgi:hypothetical protein
MYAMYLGRQSCCLLGEPKPFFHGGADTLPTPKILVQQYFNKDGTWLLQRLRDGTVAQHAPAGLALVSSAEMHGTALYCNAGACPKLRAATQGRHPAPQARAGFDIWRACMLCVACYASDQ